MSFLARINWWKLVTEGLAMGVGFCLLVMLIGYRLSSPEERKGGKTTILATFLLFLLLLAARLFLVH